MLLLFDRISLGGASLITSGGSCGVDFERLYKGSILSGMFDRVTIPANNFLRLPSFRTVNGEFNINYLISLLTFLTSFFMVAVDYVFVKLGNYLIKQLKPYISWTFYVFYFLILILEGCLFLMFISLGIRFGLS